MKLTHRDHEFNTVDLADLRSFTIDTRNGARITITESADGTLHLQEGSHRSLRIAPVVSNAVRLEVVDPFLESAAPMTPILDIAALVKLAPGTKLYSVTTQSIWTWLSPQMPRFDTSIAVNSNGSGATTVPDFWAAAAPLLLAANPED